MIQLQITECLEIPLNSTYAWLPGFFFHWIYIRFKLPIKAPFYSINFITSVTLVELNTCKQQHISSYPTNIRSSTLAANSINFINKDDRRGK